MWLLPLYASAASFEKWGEILSLCKDRGLVEHLNLHADYLDDLFPTDLILNALVATAKIDGKLAELGTMLSELSPKRFDTLVSNHFDIQKEAINQLKFPVILTGYQNTDSLWKKAMALPSGTPLTSENIRYNLGHELYEYCRMMREDGGYFISDLLFAKCVEIWSLMQDWEAIRKATVNSLSFQYNMVYSSRAKAFEGYEQEYLQLIYDHIQMDQPMGAIVMLPATVTLDQIKARGPQNFNLCIGNRHLSTDRDAIYSYLKKLADAYGTADGFDPEQFMGKWTVPPFLDLWHMRTGSLVSALMHHIPKDGSYQALETLYFFGDASLLRRMKSLDHFNLYSFAFDTFNSAYPFDAERFEEIVLLLERQFGEDARTFLQQLHRYKGQGPPSMDSGKREHITLHLIQNLLHACPSENRKEVFGPLLERAHASMAMTAHYRLLDLFLEVFTPQEILAVCQFSIVRNHMSLMLHVSPKVASYEHGKIYVPKSSPRFRNWLFHHLEYYAHFEAGKKLAWLYYDNIANFRYPETDILTDGVPFALGVQGGSRIEGGLEMKKQ